MSINTQNKIARKGLLVFAVVLLIGCLVLLAITGSEPDTEKDQYCEMVKIGIKSGGEFGWKEFKHNYKERCL